MDFTSYFSDELIPATERLRGANLRFRDKEWISAELTAVCKHYVPIGSKIKRDRVWFRARKCESPAGYENIQEVLYPPNGSPSHGRANLPFSPVLYAGWNQKVAMEEVVPAAGEYLHFAILRPRTGEAVDCHTVGEYQCVANSGLSLVNMADVALMINETMQSDLSQFHITQYVDSFLADCFSRKTEHNYEYKLTATYAEKFMRSGICIMYPSVQVPRGVNIAIPAATMDARFEVIATEVVQVLHCFGYGVSPVRTLRRSCAFDIDGKIDWTSKSDFHVQVSLQDSFRVHTEIKGWRKPAKTVGTPETDA